MVVVDADNGKVITTLPMGPQGTDPPPFDLNENLFSPNRTAASSSVDHWQCSDHFAIVRIDTTINLLEHTEKRSAVASDRSPTHWVLRPEKIFPPAFDRELIRIETELFSLVSSMLTKT